MEPPRPFRHHDSYFWEFYDAPEKFVLYETHDVNYLKELLKNDKNLRLDDRKKIMAYITATQTGIPGIRKKAISVEYFKKSFLGRYMPKYSFQHMEKELKTKIYKHDGYVSVDIVNRGYTIINELAKLNGDRLPCISFLIKNRENVYREHEYLWTDPKLGFLRLIVWPVYQDKQSKFMEHIIKEIHWISKRIRHRDFPDYNLVKIIEIYTSKILGLIAHYLIANNIMDEEHYSLNGDEIMFQPKTNFNLKAIEDFIYRRTQMNIKLHS